MSESRSVACRPLPPELWAEICTHVDDFMLWVVCRQVSSVLRAAAERDFAKMRLPLLEIHWHYGGEVIQGLSLIEWDCSGGCEGDMNYQGLSEDRQRVKFTAKFTRYTIPPDSELDTEDEKEFYEISKRNLQYKDIDFRLRFDHNFDEHFPPTMEQTCRLGSYMNDLEIPALEVDLPRESLSFDWKTFLNAFYRDYAHVQRRLQIRTTSPKTPAFTFVERANDHLALYFAGRTTLSSYSQACWTSNFGWEEDALFLQAYVKRLKISHEKIGKTLGYNDKNDVMIDGETHIRMSDHMKARRQAQNKLLLERFMKERGIKDTGIAPDE